MLRLEPPARPALYPRRPVACVPQVRSGAFGANRARLSDVAQELAHHAMDDALTLREVEVLTLVSAGNSSKTIAKRLRVTDNDRTHALTLGVTDL